MEQKKLYMAYGSNLNIEQMERLCPGAEILDKTWLKGYKLLFRGENGSAMLNIEKQNDKQVPVLIWEINNENEESLDVFEEYPIVYHKEYLEVKLKGQLEKPMVYVMNEGFSLGKPNKTYYNTVKEGYKTSGFDISKLEQALKVSSTNLCTLH